ncbi:general transcription factor IIH subunit TFB6 family [Aspergillus lucknowensis]|uniref:Uncharacterized protein n=1 Tax=Aspergillus lucknowensis TaxID=176173 RepID=A0ABR4LNA5_9EURO
MASTTTFPSRHGGFMPPSVLSPTPSTSTVTPSRLPKQRSHPLRAGSMKEATVINHVDKNILSINRRHAKKFSSAFEQPQRPSQTENSAPQSRRSGSGVGTGGETEAETEKERGYESFKEVAHDIESLVDVLWVSGTPSLQVPYLISLAVLVNTYLPDYPFTAKATFRLLRKLDSFFASLIIGEDADTGQPLSGFEGRRNIVSMTEKVRVKSIAETARVIVVETEEGRDPYDDEGEDEDESDDDEMDLEVDGPGLGEAPGKWEMETARVYEKTIQLLGDELGKAGEFCDENMARGEEGEEEGNRLSRSPSGTVL